MFADHGARICTGIGRRPAIGADIDSVLDGEDMGCLYHSPPAWISAMGAAWKAT